MSATDSRVEAEQNLTLALQNPLGYQHLSTANLIALAHTNATIYAAEQTAELVKQQRIANLITLVYADGDVLTVTPTDATWARVFADIREGLDLS